MARERSSGNPPNIPTYTSETVEKWTILFGRRLAELDALIAERVHHDDGRIDSLQTQLRALIHEAFGTGSAEYREHHYISIGPTVYHMNMTEAELQQDFESSLPKVREILVGLLNRIKEIGEFLPKTGTRPSAGTPIELGDEIFIVHGHNEEIKAKVARLVEQVGLQPIILSEKPNEGATLIEKFERNSNVGFALVLMTADDEGRALKGDADRKPRARQNVVLELGYFVGKLTRSRVCALFEYGVETPSDLHGLAYVPIDAGGAWKYLVARELQAAGYFIDMNRIS